ncbi:hypothetical protein ACQPXM_28955 [Kribbella sp. CA-253562]|uniref:hypothetical protein n=1 Tax=Kribbella sp. CA-253562 TaxID=3239942 RepID=UPI003D9067B3
MLKRALALAVLLTAPVVVGEPAQAAGTAIGPVTLAWADAEQTMVRITWTETTPVANTVGVPNVQPLGTTTVAQPNELVVEGRSFPKTAADGSQQIQVAGSDGTEALSAPFDSYVRPSSSFSLSFAAYNQLRWSLPADDAVDGTPDDPLDLPNHYSYHVDQGFDPNPFQWHDGMCTVTTTVSSTRTGVVPNPGRPFTLRVAAQNEWGQSAVAPRKVSMVPDVQVTAPGATPYGGTTTLTGHVDQNAMLITGKPPLCDERRRPLAQTTLIVHQRTSPQAPWTVVGTTRTGDDGNYRAVFRNPGPREYRVVVASHIDPAGIPVFGADSQTRSVRSVTRVVSAKFIQPTVNLGTQPQAYLWVDPAGSQKAALQFKNASGAWQGVAYKTLYAGRGILAFPWNRRGTTQFRWWVPATGAIGSTYSGVFTLTVR